MTSSDPIEYRRRAPLGSEELQQLFVAAWGASKPCYDRVLEHSYTWVTARPEGELVGFVNIAWDGGVHFFLLDTTVHPGWQRRGIGTKLVTDAMDACRGAGEWLHVDYAPELERVYRSAGFEPAAAGIARLPLAVGRVSAAAATIASLRPSPR